MPPKVDFYSTQADHPGAAARLLCKVIEKAYRQGLKVYVHADSPRQMRYFDDLLWTFRDGSFIPHERAESGADSGAESGMGRDGGQSVAAPITIGCGPIPDSDATVLCNLGAAVPESPTSLDRFERLIDASDAVEPGRTQARGRYRWYKEQGYTLTHHAV